MKVLLFTLEYPLFHGGVADYYGNLVKYWPKPADIFVLNNNSGKLINKRLPFLKWLPAYFALAAKIKQEKIEQVLVGQVLPLGLTALICSKFCKIKYSVILHGMDFSYAVKSPRKKFLSQLILKNAKNIICANSYVAKLASGEFPKIGRKIITVNPGAEYLTTHNAQRITQLREKFNFKNKIVLLSVGRLVKRKGFDKVIEALPEVLKKIPNLIYIVLGDGEELENFKFKILNLKLKDSVIIINNVQDDERDAWYNLSHIFIMPSRNINGDFEGFGIVYLEANLAGKPVIAGSSGGVGDAVVDGLNGLLVNPENIDDIAQAIIKLARDKNLRQKLGEQGRDRAIKEFNWEKQIKKIHNILIPN